MSTASQQGTPLDQVRVGDRENFKEGPPIELFRRMRSECPVHWTEGISEYPDEAGFWSVTTAEDVSTVSRDWKTYSSELGGFTAAHRVFPLELHAGDVHRDGPAQARPPQGALPARLHAQADRRRTRSAIRAITIERARPAARAATHATWSTTSRSPSVARVIGSFMGMPRGGR